ncbi:hypothetical protein KR067_002762 [Drosophila pandora]|nr:hypothetical protein KR067_002762 [Drosophila pandora]
MIDERFFDIDEDLDYSHSSLDSGQPDTPIRSPFDDTVRSIQLARRLAGLENPPGGRDEFTIMSEARERDREKKAMDRFLNAKLVRDGLPVDTPLPIYLSFREPRGVSPPSHWDATGPYKKCHHHH